MQPQQNVRQGSYHRFCQALWCLRSALLLLMMFVCASASLLSQSSLTVSPERPKRGAMLTLRYTPDSTFRTNFAASRQMYVFAYSFTETSAQPFAHSIALTKQADGSWSGTFAMPQKHIFALMKVSDGKREDDNTRAFWETLVWADDGGKPVESSLLRAGITWLGSLPEQCNRRVDLAKALELMKQEFTLYPNNVQANVAELSLAFELRQITEEAYRKRVQTLLSVPFDTTKEHYTRAMIRLLNAQNRQTEAGKVEQDFIKRYPQSELAQDKAARDVQTANSEEAFIGLAKRYIEQFPATYLASQLQGYTMVAFASRKELPQAAKFMEEQRYPSALGYNELAKFWVSRDTSNQSGLPYALKAVQLAYNPHREHKAANLTEIEWQRETSAVVPVVLTTLGSIYFQLRRDNEALATFQQALKEANNEGSKDLYLQMTTLLMEQKKFSEAYALSSQATLRFPNDNEIEYRHLVLFDTLNPTKRGGAAQERTVLLDSAKKLRTAQRIAARLNLPLGELALSQIDGKRVSLSEFKGKVLVLAFWASWCEPCTKSMPYVNYAYRKYASGGNVVFAAVNVLEERGKDRLKLLRDFYQKNPYDMPLVTDLEDDIVKKLGVTGLPVRYYIDKQGRIQYKDYGFKDAQQLYTNIDETVELLLSDAFYK